MGCQAKADTRTGAPDRIRTCDPCLRRAVLYPAELRARGRRFSHGMRAESVSREGRRNPFSDFQILYDPGNYTRVGTSTGESENTVRHAKPVATTLCKLRVVALKVYVDDHDPQCLGNFDGHVGDRASHALWRRIASLCCTGNGNEKPDKTPHRSAIPDVKVTYLKKKPATAGFRYSDPVGNLSVAASRAITACSSC